MVRKVPEPISLVEAAALPTPFYTAYRALFHRLNVRPGRTILIHGATGAVGLPCLQMAKAFGLTVIGTAGSDAGAAAIAPHCAHVLRHDSPPAAAGTGSSTGGADPAAGPVANAALVDAVRAATGGAGVHYVVEMLGNANLHTDLQLVRKGGAIVVVGSRGNAWISPRDFMRNEVTVTGVMLFENTPEEWAEAGAFIDAGLTAGVLKPVIGSVHAGLDGAPAAHEEVISHSGKGAHGKIVLQLGEEAELKA